jgi:hypothetical protein
MNGIRWFGPLTIFVAEPLPPERILARSAGSQRLVLAVWQFFRAHLDKSYSRHLGASYREDRLNKAARAADATREVTGRWLLVG